MFWKSPTSGPRTRPDVGGNPRGPVHGVGGVGGGRQRVEPYSLGHLRALFERLIDAQEGRGEGGETTVVETLRGEYGREEKSRATVEGGQKGPINFQAHSTERTPVILLYM